MESVTNSITKNCQLWSCASTQKLQMLQVLRLHELISDLRPVPTGRVAEIPHKRSCPTGFARGSRHGSQLTFFSRPGKVQLLRRDL
eukprot:s90_g5.t1